MTPAWSLDHVPNVTPPSVMNTGHRSTGAPNNARPQLRPSPQGVRQTTWTAHGQSLESHCEMSSSLVPLSHADGRALSQRGIGALDDHQTRFYLQKDFEPDDDLVPYYEICFFTDGKPLTTENTLHVEDGGMIEGRRGIVLLRTEQEFRERMGEK